MITIKIENENPFAAGWLACHLGLKADCIKLEGMEAESFADGFRCRAETAEMNDPRADRDHGGAHVAFLMETTNPNLVPFVRHRVTISKE